MPDLSEIFHSAMSLSVPERAALAEQLLASLEHLSEEEAERLWGEEAQRRLDTYRAGRATSISAEALHEKVERLLH